MNDLVAWIAAEAEKPAFVQQPREGGLCAEDLLGLGVPAHTFPGEESFTAKEHEGNPQSGVLDGKSFTAEDTGEHREDQNSAAVELWNEEERERRIYRGRTVAMLRRYMRYSLETGRMPSLLGREFFRAKVTSYTVTTFEDRVIFVHDMEKCLDRLDGFSQQIIARYFLQEHDQAETAKLLACTERTVRTYIPIVLDLLVEVLLEVGLLERVDSSSQKSCQGGLEDQKSVSCCEDGKNIF